MGSSSLCCYDERLLWLEVLVWLVWLVSYWDHRRPGPRKQPIAIAGFPTAVRLGRGFPDTFL